MQLQLLSAKWVDKAGGYQARYNIIKQIIGSPRGSIRPDLMLNNKVMVDIIIDFWTSCHGPIEVKFFCGWHAGL